MLGLQKRITEIAREIRKDFPDEPLHLVGVLKGAVFFLTDLGKQIPGEVSFDFIAVSSYGAETHTSGQVRLTRDLDSSIEGKTVIVMEDILDTGMTLQYLLRVFEQRKPKRIRIAVLLDKPERRIARGARRLRRIHDSERICRWLRARLRGALSKHARCRRTFFGNRREIELIDAVSRPKSAESRVAMRSFVNVFNMGQSGVLWSHLACYNECLDESPRITNGHAG